MTIRIVNTDHGDCVLAAGVVGKTKVVSCPNPADAASPVTLHSGDHTRPIGQSADYKHDLDSLPAIHDAALVQSWWNNADQQWETTIDGLDGIEQAIRDFIIRLQRERDAKIAAENRAKSEAERKAAVASSKIKIAELVKTANELGEAWAPGRTSARYSERAHAIFVGRWDEPHIPGYGMPVECRMLTADRDGVLSLQPHDSGRYAFA